jgi:DNA-binding transcriptional regulator YhcF (GntR family)
MNLIASKWAWTIHVNKATERLVLLALASRANKQFTCWPSQKRIAADTGLNIKTVGSALKALMSQSCILEVGRVSSKGGFVKRYQLNVALKPQPKRTEKVLETMEHDINEINSKIDRQAIDPLPNLGEFENMEATPKTTEGGGKNGSEPTPKTGRLNNIRLNKYKNNKKNNIKKSLAKPHPKLDLSKLPKNITPQAVKNFIDHRQVLKAPLTQHALEIQMREASKASSIGLTAEEAIDQTILACWKSINLDWLRARTDSQSRAHSLQTNGWDNYDPEDTSWRHDLGL